MSSTPDSEEDDSAEFTSLTMFLAAIGLHDWAPKVKHSTAILSTPSCILLQFIRERIDLEALMLLGEADLGDLGMQMGPRKKLLKAVAERR